MITTFPGFHLIGALCGIINKVFYNLIFGVKSKIFLCNVCFLRWMNACFGIVNFFLTKNIYFKINKRISFLCALCVYFFPIHYFYTLLYYTDVPSLTFVLACKLFCLDKKILLASVSGTLSILIRQTNIIWVTFFLFECVLVDLELENSRKCLYYQILDAIRKLWTSKVLLFKYIYLFIIPVCFLVFVFFNKGIVIGDKNAHIPVFHLAQIAYYFSIMFAFVWPILSTIKINSVKSKTSILFFILTIFAFFIGRNEHIYLISDNRHYSFYLWKKIIKKQPWNAIYGTYCGISSVYVINAILVVKEKLWCLAFLICVIFSLVPSGLLEFRY